MKAPIIDANLACLKQGIQLIETLEAAAYTSKTTSCFSSTIGEHMRHNIDHYTAFIKGHAGGFVDYDMRERSSAVETDPAEAIQSLKTIHQELALLGNSHLDRRVKVKMDEGGEGEASDSSIRRELQFLLSHTIHHYALIVAIACANGIQEFPQGFGVAPSTLRHQATTTP